MQQHVSKSAREWQETTYRKAREKVEERKVQFTTSSDIPVQPLYTQEDLAQFQPQEQLGYPGEFPFTRGVQPSMYRSRFWTMRQYAGFGTAEESNKRYHYLLSQGTTGLSVAFDLPTQIGYDADHPLAAGEVGKVGVSISSLEDMETLLHGLPLERISTSMTINATASILLALYIAVAKKQGADVRKLSGTIQNDILKEYVARGTYIYPPEHSMRLITDIFKYCAEHVPRWNTISISGYHIREAGATAAQEIAFTLSNAIAYVQAAIDAGLNVDRFAGQLSFFFNCHNNFFEEICKFRAARRMWAHIMRERFHAQEKRSMMLRFHTQTAGSTLTAQQPDNNIIRTAYQAMAAVLGGTQSLHTNSKDEALSLPTEESARIALRTQQILAYETGVADTVDPLAGSYFIETLTNQLEEAAWQYIHKIDELGGSVRAIEKGYLQSEIEQAAYDYQLSLERGTATVVGVNRFTIENEVQPEIQRVDPEVGKRQAAKLAALRQRRDNEQVQNRLQALQDAARGSKNLMPFIIEAVEAYATLGEISDALRHVFGEQREFAAEL
ncbi:methylmalonyl-CoA mutase N-terminal domain/subunit [Thermosporothrix hazakensis]|jgi:methylmalonyl-CoA mutase N-terminal domain/subunit|uniref:Methylmalonyl-CoA mutase N-terminal domain/subunit n=1 Tax=Thermosporothrix hazakensis TaxID=644383 RepID=A0A326UFQ0_THEHA|nr:methylmalonyl-CoA mutase family protein [Thermosporothrix hazakensis]PZW36774.1 methylmalonyl-CoA mutase N-terminal domain/subunit [Thermosporothrix hazakensis]GCE47424.1 methylmalonyl-CoA mutase [Thermosporothrix hazakensis]